MFNDSPSPSHVIARASSSILFSSLPPPLLLFFLFFQAYIYIVFHDLFQGTRFILRHEIRESHFRGLLSQFQYIYPFSFFPPFTIASIRFSLSLSLSLSLSIYLSIYLSISPSTQPSSSKAVSSAL